MRTSRRTFLLLGGAASLVLWLPKVEPAPDSYDAFLARVWQKVQQIMESEGRWRCGHVSGTRDIKKFWIDSPRVSADGTHYTRKVHIVLAASPSLLQKTHFEFDVPWEVTRG